MKQKRFSIRIKTALIVVTFSLILLAASMVYFSIVSSKNNENLYKKTATNLSATVSEVIDAEKVKSLRDQVKTIADASEYHPLSTEWGSDRWNEYIAQFNDIKNLPEYIALRSFLNTIAEANTDEINCIYLAYVDTVNENIVFTVDSENEDNPTFCPPGCIDPLEDANRNLLTDPTLGFPAYLSKTEKYGYLVIAGSPIYLGDEVVGYAMVDISMAVVRNSQKNNILNLFVYLMIMTIVLTAAALVGIHLIFIKPLKKLTEAANSYDINEIEKTHESFSKLKLKTKDELSELSSSIKKIENDVYTKIHEVNVKKAELSSSKEELQAMRALANKDALTGVRNNIAYKHVVSKMNESIAKGELDTFGVAMIDLNDLKKINDGYGHKHGDVALIKLTNVICTIFAHSPVFRTGGDEFVVIMKNTDYRNSDALIDEFNHKIEELVKDEELTPAERISASIGYSKFDPNTDETYEDVYRRADEAMYIRKRFMKSNKY